MSNKFGPEASPQGAIGNVKIECNYYKNAK